MIFSSLFTADNLPLVKSLSDCGSYYLTVEPYLPQLKTLPIEVLQVRNLNQLESLYISTNPLVTAIAIALALAPIFLVVSEINRNYSQVDRCWSILPTIYNAHFCLWAHLNGLPTKRLDHILAVSCVWSLRLTFNYWRKGGYSIGSEDYRWEVLRQHINAPLFFVFNVIFISLAQSILLVLVTMPTYVFLVAAKLSGNTMTTGDLVFSRILLGLVVVEYFADQQQWNYQEAKRSYQKTANPTGSYSKSDLDRGFLTKGLWAWSRHPNFAAEQAVWVLLYQWSCYETFSYYNWTVLGAVGYLCLFQASTWFTELITSRKYPAYAEYQKRVSKFLPKPTTRAMPDEPEVRLERSGKNKK